MRIAKMMIAAMMKRKPAAVTGGAPSRPTLIMIQVELQIRQRALKTMILIPLLIFACVFDPRVGLSF
jgi:hypothetical protein